MNHPLRGSKTVWVESIRLTRKEPCEYVARRHPRSRAGHFQFSRHARFAPWKGGGLPTTTRRTSDTRCRVWTCDTRRSSTRDANFCVSLLPCVRRVGWWTMSSWRGSEWV